MSTKGYNRRHHRYGHRHHSDKPKPVVGEKARELLEKIDENCPTIQMFKQFAIELDTKHDRYERIIKISRDVTIESKRIIFLLHSIDRESKHDIILKEAEQRLKNIANVYFKAIAYELENQDPYQYCRAYSAGLQEYIEAFTYYQYLKTKNIDNWLDIQKQFRYKVSNDAGTKTSVAGGDTSDLITDEDAMKEIQTFLPPPEFILGIADLTGELMRKCINSLSLGKTDECFQTCDFVKNIYKGFLGIGNTQGHKEISRKCYVLKQSLEKMEFVCYNIIVRGNEIPQYTLVHVLTSNPEQSPEKEDYYEKNNYD